MIFFDIILIIDEIPNKTDRTVPKWHLELLFPSDTGTIVP